MEYIPLSDKTSTMKKKEGNKNDKDRDPTGKSQKADREDSN